VTFDILRYTNMVTYLNRITGPDSGIGLADNGTHPTAAARTSGNHVTIDAILSRDVNDFRFLFAV